MTLSVFCYDTYILNIGHVYDCTKPNRSKNSDGIKTTKSKHLYSLP